MIAETHTNEQEVVAARAELARLKVEFMRHLQDYINASQNSSQGLLDLLLSCQQSGTAYFNFAEDFVGNSDLLGAHESALWAQGFAEDCAEILKSMPGYFEFLQTAFLKLGLPADNVLPGSTAFANMQRMVSKYLSRQERRTIEGNFNSSKLPVYGFRNEARYLMSKKSQTILCFVFGVLFLSLIIAIALLKPNPTTYQYTVFRTVQAIAGAGVVASFPGFIELQLGGWLRAGGALAAFVLLYFWNPAALGAQPTFPR